MGRKHTAALVTKTREIPALAEAVFVTRAPHGTPTPYMVWHPARGTNVQAAVTGPRIIKQPRFTGHIVGETGEQVETIADLLEELLFAGGRGVVLAVDGEKSDPLWFAAPLPVQDDGTPLPAIAYQVVEVGWTAQPIPRTPTEGEPSGN